ncbi:MAG: hypothetical protein IPI61_10090 [Syntrophaceae bacterium]|nr:hypothetical protein [Syntrophaceae bacterium]
MSPCGGAAATDHHRCPDDDALQWWGMRIAMQTAVDEAAQTPGVVFVTVLTAGAVRGLGRAAAHRRT